MKILVLPLAIIGLVLSLALAGPLHDRWQAHSDYQSQVEALDLQARLQAQIDAQRHTEATAASRAAMSNLGYLGAGAGVILILMFAIDYYRQRRTPLVRYNPDRPMVSRAQIEASDPALLAAFYRRLELSGAAEIARAVHQPGQLPASLNYRNESFADMPSAPAQISTSIPVNEALALPDTARLSDMLPNIPTGQLCYGTIAGGKPLMMTFGQAYHALAAGDTRTGKSNYLDSIIVQLHHQAVSSNYDLRLMIGDFKREMASTWRRSELVETVETDPAIIADMLIELAHGPDGILQRYSEFERVGEQQQRIIRNIGDYCRVTRTNPRLVFCVVDELNALIEAADRKDDLASALKVVLQTGAGAGIYVLGGAQYLTAKVFGRDGSKQFTTRALFGAFDQTAAGMVFGQGKIDSEARTLLTGAPGRGLIRTAGQAMPTAFQALHCEESDILHAVKLITADQPTIEISERLNSQRTAYEPAEPAFRKSAEQVEIAPIVRRLAATEGWSKTRIIETLWGVQRGGSKAYKEASAAYDQIVSVG